jgi:asparagine synthase (glutamine-hydrolysing)
MSGIFGVVDLKRKNNLYALIEKMSGEMSHKEWYISENYVDDERGLAVGRIGIGIFNKAKQPVWNASGMVALVMAGEFYKRGVTGNDDGSQSDEEFALALYEKNGAGFVAQLTGAFIIGIYDKREKRVLIVNDRFGLYPLFYSCQNEQLLFAPEMKGILCSEYFSRRLDLTALAQYVRFQQLLGARTFFEDIYLLPGGSILSYDVSSGACAVKSYWSYDDIPYRPEVDFDEAVEETGMLFRRAVKRLSSDSFRPGVYLSGGLDSRSILGMIDRRPVVSLTYGTKNCRDVYYAERIARTVGSDHHWVDFPNGKWVEQVVGLHLELTEGFHSWIHAHGMSTLSQARELMDVNLTGWDGGTVLGRLDSLEPLQDSLIDDLALVTRVFNRLINGWTWPSINEVEEKLLYNGDIRKKVLDLAYDSFREEINDYLHYRPDVRGEYFFIDSQCRRMTQNGVVFTRSHVEVRFPFFDYDLFDFLNSVPGKLRAQRKLYNAMIQREMPQLAYIPYDYDEFLPTPRSFFRGIHAETVKFKRRVNKYIMKVFPEHHTLYADYENYLRTDLREWAEGILYDQRTADRGLFEPSLLRSLMCRHLAGHEQWTIGKIAPLMTYEMMLRRYYD